MHIVSRIQNDILNQDTIDDKLASSRKSIIKKIKSNAIVNYISKYHTCSLISSGYIKEVKWQARHNLVFSETYLQRNVELRVIGYSIVKLNQ